MLEIISGITGLALVSSSPSLFLYEYHFLCHSYTFFQGNHFGLERNYFSLYPSFNVALLFYDLSLNNRDQQHLIDIRTCWIKIKKFKISWEFGEIRKLFGKPKEVQGLHQAVFLKSVEFGETYIKIVNTKSKLSLRTSVFPMSNSLLNLFSFLYMF